MEQIHLENQLEQLHSRYVGTGHPDLTRHEFIVNQHRDSIATYIGHPNVLRYMVVAQGKSMERTRYELLMKMIQPCGPAPPPPKYSM